MLFRASIACGSSNRSAANTNFGARRVLYCTMLALFAVASANSCVSIPQETYLKKGSTANLKKIALNVSSQGLSVSNSSRESLSGRLFPLLGLVFVGIEAAVRNRVDNQLAASAESALDISYIEKLLADSFREQVTRGLGCELLPYTGELTPTALRSLTSEAYDAVITLEIAELFLRPTSEVVLRPGGGEMLVLHASIRGRMVDVRTGETIWDRRELAMSDDEQYSFDSNKAQSGQLLKEVLERVLKKITGRLAIDIDYSN